MFREHPSESSVEREEAGDSRQLRIAPPVLCVRDGFGLHSNVCGDFLETQVAVRPHLEQPLPEVLLCPLEHGALKVVIGPALAIRARGARRATAVDGGRL